MLPEGHTWAYSPHTALRYRCHSCSRREAQRSGGTMRAISNRIRRLERTLVPPVLDEGESAADILRARRRRRLEAAGLPFEEEPRIRWMATQSRNVSLVDILSGRHAEKASLLHS